MILASRVTSGTKQCSSARYEYGMV